MTSKYPIKKISILNCWLTSYFFLFGFVITMTTHGMASFHMAIVNSLLGAVILILNSFANLALLLFFERKVFVNKKVHRIKYLVFSFGLSFLVYIIILLCYAVINNSVVSLSTFIYVFVICILINSIILALQSYVVIYDAKVNADIENSQLKAANADAANQLLRQQVHPHFLFNALNILKSLYRVNPKLGEEYLIRLSDFLRAAVSNNNTKLIALKEEIKLCVDYLEMQKIRFNNGLMYSVDISEEALQTGYLPSFSIQPLLENAIKHNELTEESPLHIEIKQDGNRIKTSNNLQIKNTTETSTGSGLINLSERYKLLSNDEPIIEETDKIFSVSIKILKNEDRNH